MGSAPRAGRALRAGLEPGVDKTREPDQERRDPVLDVVVSRAGLVTRHPGRKRPGRLGPVDDRERDQRKAGDDGEGGDGGMARHWREDDTPVLRLLGVRGVRELAELAGDEVGGLLTDVDRVVADPLETA